MVVKKSSVVFKVMFISEESGSGIKNTESRTSRDTVNI